MGQHRTGFFMKVIRLRTTAGWFFLMLLAVFSQPTRRSILMGLVLALSGEVVRTLSAGIIRKNEMLARCGPYSWCRHPLYFGSFLITLGTALASNFLPLIILGIFLFGFFYIPTITAEEKYLAEKFGEEYLNYRKKTPVLLPRPGKTSWQEFSWENIRCNREHINWLLLFALFIWLALRQHFGI